MAEDNAALSKQLQLCNPQQSVSSRGNAGVHAPHNLESPCLLVTVQNLVSQGYFMVTLWL